MWTLQRKDSFEEIALTWVWALVAWLIWSIFILIISIFIWNYINLFSIDSSVSRFWSIKVEPVFTILISLITLIWTSITSLLTYFLLWKTNPENYKKNNVIFSQIAYLQILIYVCITPIYIFFWWTSYDNITISYIIHVLSVIFSVNIFLDILNNYRYVMIWIYGTFIWTFLTTIISIIIYNNSSGWKLNFIILIFLIPLINFLIILLKKLFELWYYYFHTFTWADPIWDIFYKIKKEDEENEKLKNNFI